MIFILGIFAYVFIGFVVTIVAWWIDEDDEDWEPGLFFFAIAIWPMMIFGGAVVVAINKIKDLKKDYYGND